MLMAQANKPIAILRKRILKWEEKNNFIVRGFVFSMFLFD